MRFFGFIFTFVLIQQMHAQGHEGLRASSYYLDLGTTQVNQEKTFEIGIKNHAAQSLHLKEVYGNCSCVKVTYFPDTLEAGAEDTLRGYMLSGTKGELLKYLILISDGEPSYQKVGLKLLVE